MPLGRTAILTLIAFLCVVPTARAPHAPSPSPIDRGMSLRMEEVHSIDTAMPPCLGEGTSHSSFRLRRGRLSGLIRDIELKALAEPQRLPARTTRRSTAYRWAMDVPLRC